MLNTTSGLQNIRRESYGLLGLTPFRVKERLVAFKIW
jgi:hypothetical protein